MKGLKLFIFCGSIYGSAAKPGIGDSPESVYVYNVDDVLPVCYCEEYFSTHD